MFYCFVIGIKKISSKDFIPSSSYLIRQMFRSVCCLCIPGSGCLGCLSSFVFCKAAQVERCDSLNDAAPPFFNELLIWFLEAFDVSERETDTVGGILLCLI